MTSFLLVIVVLILITAIIIIVNIYAGHKVKHFYTYIPHNTHTQLASWSPRFPTYFDFSLAEYCKESEIIPQCPVI